jgi:HD-like signal output (HDOD) protein
LVSKGQIKSLFDCAVLLEEMPTIIDVDFQTLCLKISRSENLPVLPGVVLDLLQLFGDENVSPRKLESIISQDSGLTAKVLRVASSPAYGTGACETISRAISLIGMNRMKQIAVSLGYQQLIHEKPLVASFDRVYFWEHCKATSLLAREIMAVVNKAKQESAFTAGLIFHVGLLAMERFSPAELNHAIGVSKSKNICLKEAEMLACGFTHKQVSEELAKKWVLAPFIIDAITNHDHPEKSTVDNEICSTVAIANTMAYEMGYPPVRGVISNHTTQGFLDRLDISVAQLSEIANKVMIEMSGAAQDSYRAA